MANVLVNTTPVPDVTPDKGSYILGFATAMESHMTQLYNQMKTDLNAVENGSADDPRVLAAFQASLQAYEIFRSAQSSTDKGLKDLDQSILQNLH